MRRRRRISSFVAAVLLTLGLSVPMPASAATLYFTAVNDSVAPLTSDSMPFWSNGAIYVPYSIFDANLNGIGVSLGLYTSYNRSNNTVTLFNLRQMLVFDLNNGTCWDDMTKVSYSGRAVQRSGKAYLPLNTVSSFFGLSYSYNQLPYIAQGYLVRIKSSEAVNDDPSFVDAARNVINNRLRDYTQSLSFADTTVVAGSTKPGASQGGSVNEGTSTAPGQIVPGTSSGLSRPVTPGAGQQGTASDEPADLPAPPEPDETETATYLAFRCESAGGLAAILNTMDANSRSAVFFLTPRLIEEEGDLVRRALGTGQSVGVLLNGGEDAEAQLARGNAALEAAAHTRTTLAYAPAGQRQALEDLGWVCWNETTLLQPSGSSGASSFASNAIRRLRGQKGEVYLTVESGEQAAQVLPTLLRQLGSSDYIVSIPVETKL